MIDPIKQAEKQAQRYWYVDGLSEMAAGGILLVLALYYAAQGWFAPADAPGWQVTVLQLGVFVGSVLLAQVIVRALKERITYPRTGYVALRRVSGPKRSLLVAVTVMLAAVVALAVTLAARSSLVSHWLMPLAPGLFIAYMGYSYGLTRFYAMAVYTTVVSVGNTYLGLGPLFDSALFFTAFGLGWLVTGAWALRRYLASTRPAGEQEAE